MGILDIIRRRVVSPALNYLTRTLPRRITQLLGRKPTQNIQNLRIQPLTKRLGAGGITPGEPLVPVPPEIAPRPPEPLKLPTKRGILTPIPKAIAPKPPTPKNKSFLQGLVGASIFGKPEEQKAFKEGRAKDAPLFSLGTLQNVYKDILFGSVEEQKERKQ
jgi:hypothetical protein